MTKRRSVVVRANTHPMGDMSPAAEGRTSRVRLLARGSIPFAMIALCGAVAAMASANVGSRATDPRSDPTPTTAATPASRASLNEQLTKSPGIALVLPSELPSGYSWVGLDSFERNDAGQTVARSSTFAAWGQLDKLPTVQICSNTSAARTCPHGDSFIERKLEGIQVTIAFTGGNGQSGSAEVWKKVALSDSLDVAWLRD